MNKKRAIIAAIVIAAILILTAGFLVWEKYYKTKPVISPASTTETKTEKPQTLGEQIYQEIQNPAEKLPTTNPYEAKTNPFEEAKTNPFENIYKNPFGQ